MLLGKLEECYGCHRDRAGDGFLFGVPAAERVGVGPEGDDDAERPPDED